MTNCQKIRPCEMIRVKDYMPSKNGAPDQCCGVFYVLTALDFNYKSRSMKLDKKNYLIIQTLNFISLTKIWIFKNLLEELF